MTIHALLWVDAPLVQRVGRTLGHLLWQGLAAAALLRVALAVVRDSATVRYAVACVALAAVVGAAAVTFAVVGDAPPAARVVTAAVPMPALPLSPLPVVTTADAPRFDWHIVTAGLVLLWTVGVAGQAGWHLAGWARVRRLGREPALTDDRWVKALSTAAARLGVARPARLLASAKVDVPVVLGVLRPAVVVPLSLITELPPEHILTVLAHELAHVRRHDYLVNLIQCGVEAVFFYHPAVWWMSAVVRREREFCCDDLAAIATGSRSDVASALVAIEAERFRAVALAMSATGGSLARRVRRLLDVAAPRRTTAGRLGATMIASCIIVVLAGWLCRPTRSHAQSRPTSQPAVWDRGTIDRPSPMGEFSGDSYLQLLETQRAEVRQKLDELAEQQLLSHGRTGAEADLTTQEIAAKRALAARLDALVVARLAELRKVGTAGAAPHIHVTIGRDGFIAVDGGVGNWETVRDRLARLPASVRPTAVIDLVMESGDVPVRELFQAEADLSRAMHDHVGCRVEVGATEPGPVPTVGEVYIGGHVPRVGVYSVNGRRITVKQLILSAGGTDADVGDERALVTIYRRSAGDREVVSKVRYTDILRGAAPDTYVLPNDVVEVTSSDPTTRPARR